MNANQYLEQARKDMEQRAALRDSPQGERSMAAAVEAFNALSGHKLTEAEGWRFMGLLKTARAMQGDYHEDDYTDKVAYAALEAEAAYREDRDAGFKRAVIKINSTIPDVVFAE